MHRGSAVAEVAQRHLVERLRPRTHELKALAERLCILFRENVPGTVHGGCWHCHTGALQGLIHGFLGCLAVSADKVDEETVVYHLPHRNLGHTAAVLVAQLRVLDLNPPGQLHRLGCGLDGLDLALALRVCIDAATLLGLARSVTLDADLLLIHQTS